MIGEQLFGALVFGATNAPSTVVAIPTPSEKPRIVLSATAGMVSAESRFPPYTLFEGYTSDGVNITIPITALPILTLENTDVSAGDWRQIFQSLLLKLNNYFLSTPQEEHPQTIRSFMIENWNAKSNLFEYGYGNKRDFQVSFNIAYKLQKIKDEVQ